MVFANGRQRVAVEVKAQDASIGDLVRGIFQCVKYGAVLDAEARARQKDVDCSAILALGSTLPSNLSSLRATPKVGGSNQAREAFDLVLKGPFAYEGHNGPEMLTELMVPWQMWVILKRSGLPWQLLEGKVLSLPRVPAAAQA